jgi:hypothetical protein
MFYLWDAQTSAVVDMHGAPRFGHSNHIGSLASRDRDVQFDYANGVSSLEPPCFVWCQLELILAVPFPPTLTHHTILDFLDQTIYSRCDAALFLLDYYSVTV